MILSLHLQNLFIVHIFMKKDYRVYRLSTQRNISAILIQVHTDSAGVELTYLIGDVHLLYV